MKYLDKPSQGVSEANQRNFLRNDECQFFGSEPFTVSDGFAIAKGRDGN